MQKDKKSAPGAWRGLWGRIWSCRRSFKGFGLLLFYCHMLMLFAFIARTRLGDAPEYALLTRSGGVLVPVMFAIVTVSLFIPRLAWLALALGFAHVIMTVWLLLCGPALSPLWLLGPGGLLALLVLALRLIIRMQDKH